MPSSYDPNNIFTKIIAGDIPSHKIFEDDVCVSIMDIMPESRGHVLVVPKKGARNLIDVDPDDLAELMKRVQKIAVAVKKSMRADGILLRQSSEEVAGQTVYHLHFHIIPCYAGQRRNRHGEVEVSNDDLAEIAEHIRAAL
ncbi:HIT family protein [Maritalea porphyrae]|jgi:histidine triad (HIT) family protein|uniref:HIT family protein n=1 Tax=Maritalea porphyrae TaxID=880732 RepID=UPI0022AF4D17|nr:HIT family protein [Maritalea porphyrae]MCZ4272902.1 HIT family protein [Maritalea porphyrae]